MPGVMDASCWVSPADEKGNVDNILTRLAKVEEILSLLMGMDISATQLADITAKAGVLEDLVATKSNAAGGWTTDGTFSGVAISTLGWKMSDGKEFPIVVMQDGVLQFGFNNDGSIGGTRAAAWDAAATEIQDYVSYSSNNTAGALSRSSRGCSFGAITIESPWTSTEIRLRAGRAGLYLVSGHFSQSATGTVATHDLQNSMNAMQTPNLAGGLEVKQGFEAVCNNNVFSANNSGAFSTLWPLGAGQEISLSLSATGSATPSRPFIGFSMVRISN